jgi:O-methyltransferase involved in polyketide biosynthesis
VFHPVTQAEKKKAIVRRLGALPPHVRFVPIDFGMDTLDAALPDAGFRSEARTLPSCHSTSRRETSS